jgi:hypothetical protein
LSISPPLLNIVLKGLPGTIRCDKTIKWIQILAEEFRLSVFVEAVLLYLESKDYTRKLLDVINALSKVAGYRINIQKSVVVLYTNKEYAEKEITKIIPFTIASKKYLGIKLTKEVNDLCNGNLKH